MWEKTIATTLLLMGILVVSAQAQYDPTASIDSYNNPSLTGETVTFDASMSDPGMNTFFMIYEWHIDGQMVYEGYWDEETYQHTFTLPPGETSKDYTIRLRVWNDLGYYDDDTMIQTVEKEWQHYTHIKDHLGSVRSTIGVKIIYWGNRGNM